MWFYECECVGEAARYSGIFHPSGMVPGIHRMMPFVGLVDVSLLRSYHSKCHKYLVSHPVVPSSFDYIHLFQSHSILSHPLIPLHSFILYSRSTPQRHGSFLAPGHENMHVAASVRLLPWRWDGPIIYLAISVRGAFMRAGMRSFKSRY